MMSLSRWSLPAVLVMSGLGGATYLFFWLAVGGRVPLEPQVRERATAETGARTVARSSDSAESAVIRIREVQPPLPPIPEVPGPSAPEVTATLDPHERSHLMIAMLRDGIPDARSVCASAVANPRAIELEPRLLDQLGVELRDLGRQDLELQRMQSEIIDRSVQAKISRGQTLPLDAATEAFQVPPGAVGFSRIEKGRPGFRILLHPGEFPELDGVRASRDELILHAFRLVNSYLLP